MTHPGPSPAPGLFGIRGLTPLVLAVGLLWVGVVVLAWWISQRTGQRVPLCLFRRVTGMPCPTCGGTRCAMSLATGDPAAAFVFNPLVAVFLLCMPLWIGWKIVTRRRPYRPWSPRTRKVVGGAALAALALNWAYVLWHESW